MRIELELTDRAAPGPGASLALEKNAGRSAATSAARNNARNSAALVVPNAIRSPANREATLAAASLVANSGPAPLAPIPASQKIAHNERLALVRAAAPVPHSVAGPKIAPLSVIVPNARSSGTTGPHVPALARLEAIPHHPSSHAAQRAADNSKGAPRAAQQDLAPSAPGAPLIGPHAVKVSPALIDHAQKNVVRIGLRGPNARIERIDPASIFVRLKIATPARRTRTAQPGANVQRIEKLVPASSPAREKIAAVRATRDAAPHAANSVQTAPKALAVNARPKPAPAATSVRANPADPAANKAPLALAVAVVPAIAPVVTAPKKAVRNQPSLRAAPQGAREASHPSLARGALVPTPLVP